MPWFKVDDNLAFHPKALTAGNEALGMWVRAGSWSAQQLTDGRVRAEIWRSLGRKRAADRLVAAGLWLPEPEGDGYLFHEWADYQPTRADVLERRKRDALRLQKWRDEHAE